MDDPLNFKVFLRLSLKQWPTEKKGGKTAIQKFEYLENKKSFLDKIKTIFHNYLRAIIW